MSTTDHWDDVYRSRPEEDLGWYEPVPSTLPDVLEFAHDRSARIVDVGAGASRLADELIDRGYEAVTLVDVSDAAFDRVRQRLAARGLPEPTIVVADATGLDLGTVLSSVVAAILVLVIGFGAFCAGWVDGGEVKLATVATLWIGAELVVPFLALAGLFAQ